jgi:alpha-L-arabinofuranosidase
MPSKLRDVRDTRAARGAESEAEAYAFLNDPEQAVGGDVIEAPNIYGVVPAIWSQRSGQPYLDVGATYDEAKQRVTLAVVNRRKEGDLLGSIELAGWRARPGGRAFQITGTSPEAGNTFANPRAVVTQEVKLEASGSRFQYQLPRHSISWLECEAA